MGTAPVIQDGDLTMGESGAIVEYIIHKYGNGRLALPPSNPDYAQYLFWFHFANATLQQRRETVQWGFRPPPGMVGSPR